ncbi:MAG: leucyl/phenylalanyl-tRNA--protein transferase family protein [Treponema sp.]|nr:leucyl/phenylalanyl-tRNA--protein transferase family protein [Treponema sp.]
MSFYPLHYLPSGHVIIIPEDDCDRLVDSLLVTSYAEEFCVALDFDEDFIIQMMEAGFLIMSAEFKEPGVEEKAPFYLLLPKLHLTRSTLFFSDLHIKKSIIRFLPRYELHVDRDFDCILDACVETHGSDWLTPPLVEMLKRLHRKKGIRTKPVSFGVYRDGELKAGEIGIVMGRVYTSYSGYCRENNAGTVQMILMAQWLSETGFAFLDFGMPLDYKTNLGARNIDPPSFVELFRSSRD